MYDFPELVIEFMKEKKGGKDGMLTENRTTNEDIGSALQTLVEAGKPINTNALIDVLSVMSQAAADSDQRQRLDTAIRTLRNLQGPRGRNSSIRML